jgi:hypothetical protein
MRSIQPVIDLFSACKTWEEFEIRILSAGYEEFGGCYKKVFVHPRKKYVAKIVHGIDDYPHPKSRVSKFYLYPPWKPIWRGFSDWRNRRGRFFKVGLIFQPRVNTNEPEKTLRELKVCLKLKKARWAKDSHEGNVGIYRGKPVIIDY